MGSCVWDDLAIRKNVPLYWGPWQPCERTCLAIWLYARRRDFRLLFRYGSHGTATLALGRR